MGTKVGLEVGVSVGSEVGVVVGNALTGHAGLIALPTEAYVTDVVLDRKGHVANLGPVYVLLWSNMTKGVPRKELLPPTLSARLLGIMIVLRAGAE